MTARTLFVALFNDSTHSLRWARGLMAAGLIEAGCRLMLGDFAAGWQVTNRNTTSVAKQRLPVYRVSPLVSCWPRD